MLNFLFHTPLFGDFTVSAPDVDTAAATARTFYPDCEIVFLGVHVG